MLTGLDPLTYVVVAQGGLIVLFFGLVFRGLLVSRRHLVDAHADRDRWETAWRTENEAGHIRERQNDQLINTLAGIASSMEGVERVLDEIRRRGT